MKIEVDGSLSIEKLIELASHNEPLFNNGFEAKRFPVTNTQKRIVAVKLIQFPKKDSHVVDYRIKERGLRSLFIEEFLYFSHFFPDKQRTCSIITLGCHRFGNYGKAYPCLTMGFFGKVRQLTETYLDTRNIDFSKIKFAVTNST